MSFSSFLEFLEKETRGCDCRAVPEMVDLNLLQSRAKTWPEQHNVRNKQDESRNENASSDLREVIKQWRDNSPQVSRVDSSEVETASRKLEHISSSRMTVLLWAGVKLQRTQSSFLHTLVTSSPSGEHNLIRTPPYMNPPRKNKTTTYRGHRYTSVLLFLFTASRVTVISSVCRAFHTMCKINK